MDARLGRAARRKRLEAGLDLLDVAAIAGVSQPTLSRFEQGDGWRRETNTIVAAYATACGITPRDIWLLALNDSEGDA